MRIERLVLVVPGLLRPEEDGRARAAFDAPHLARLIAAAGSPQREADGIDAVLAPLYGIARQTDWPLAPIKAESLGAPAGSAYWLCADPVTLVAGRDNVRLEGAVPDLDASEAAALVSTLNAHFRDDGIAFLAPRPERWFVRTETVQALVTRPLAAALGRTLRHLLPTGPDAARWRRWQDEIQMLFFEHPINVKREAERRALVSGVWLSEGGTRPAIEAKRVRTLADAGTTAYALAAFAGRPAQAPAAHPLAAMVAQGDADTAVAACADTVPPQTMERTLAAPAWQCLAAGKVATVEVVTDGDGEAVVWRTRRPSAWQRMIGGPRGAELARLLAAARANTGTGF